MSAPKDGPNFSPGLAKYYWKLGQRARTIREQSSRAGPEQVLANCGLEQFLSCRYEDFVRQRAVADRAGEHQGADHLGHRRDRLTPPRRLRASRRRAGDDLDQRLQSLREG